MNHAEPDPEKTNLARSAGSLTKGTPQTIHRYIAIVYVFTAFAGLLAAALLVMRLLQHADPLGNLWTLVIIGREWVFLVIALLQWYAVTAMLRRLIPGQIKSALMGRPVTVQVHEG